MLSDKEVDELALELLSNLPPVVHAWEDSPIEAIQINEIGEVVMVFRGSHPEYGGFKCEYSPYDAIKRLIRLCEDSFDSFYIEITDNKGTTKKYPVGESLMNRTNVVRSMAETGTVYMLTYFKEKIKEALTESLEDGRLMARTILQGATAKFLGDQKADIRREIAVAAQRVAARKQEALIGNIARLPNVLAHRKRGAPAKTVQQRARDREQCLAKATSAYRKLAERTNRRVTKTDVARDMGIGGDPKRGGQSALQVFNKKLKNLNISWDDIVSNAGKEIDK